MAVSVLLNEQLVNDAKVVGNAEHRETGEQIEYWAKIGKIMIDNPELNFSYVQEALLSKAEVDLGRVNKYTRRT